MRLKGISECGQSAEPISRYWQSIPSHLFDVIEMVTQTRYIESQPSLFRPN